MITTNKFSVAATLFSKS